MKNQIDKTEVDRRIFQQFMDIYINPDVKKRQQKGELPKPLVIFGAQIIFYPDGRGTEVRINQEVKARGKAKLKPESSLNMWHSDGTLQIEEPLEIMLTKDDDPDCGHVTLLLLRDGWRMAYDFHYNKGLSRKNLDVASQFLKTARFAREENDLSSFVDNLFSACELTAKAYLLLHPDQEFRKRTNHKAIKSKFNREANWGNVRKKHKEVFNKLSSLRDDARYLKCELMITKEETKEMLSVVAEMIDIEKERINR